jgi:hypothetical protein
LSIETNVLHEQGRSALRTFLSNTLYDEAFDTEARPVPVDAADG